VTKETRSVVGSLVVLVVGLAVVGVILASVAKAAPFHGLEESVTAVGRDGNDAVARVKVTSHRDYRREVICVTMAFNEEGIVGKSDETILWLNSGQTKSFNATVKNAFSGGEPVVKSTCLINVDP